MSVYNPQSTSQLGYDQGAVGSTGDLSALVVENKFEGEVEWKSSQGREVA